MGTNQDEIQLYEELKGFLLSDRFDLRFAATDAVLQQVLPDGYNNTDTTTNGTSAIVAYEKNNGNKNKTDDQDAIEKVDGYTNENLEKIVRFGIVPLLAKNSSYTVDDDNDDDDTSSPGASGSDKNHHVQGLVLSVNSLKALVHLSSNGYYANQVIHELITQSGGMNRMIEIVLSSPPSVVPVMMTPSNPNNLLQPPPSVTEILWKQRVNYAMSLLANMTRIEEGAIEMTGLTIDDTAIQQPLTEKLPPKPSLELIYSRYMNPTFIRTTTPTTTSSMPNNNNNNNNNIVDDTNKSSSTIPSSALQMHATNNNNNDPTVNKNDDGTVDSNYNDPYQHFSAVLMNITQIEQGRQFVLKIHRSGGKKKKENKNHNNDDVSETVATVMEKDVTKEEDVVEEEQEWTILQLLLSQLRSPNPIRRRGIAGMIRNCVLDRDSAWWFIHIVQITKHLLYPLAGPEELDYDEKQGLEPELWLEGPDKVRETDVCTRLYLVEAILLLLGSGRYAREQLRIQRVYVILKVADMVETNEEITELIYECVNYLRADEPGTYEGSSDQSVKDAYNGNLILQPTSNKTGQQQQPKASAAVGERKTNDNDDEDLDDID